MERKNNDFYVLHYILLYNYNIIAYTWILHRKGVRIMKKYWIYKWSGCELKVKYCNKQVAIETANRLRKLINLIDKKRNDLV